LVVDDRETNLSVICGLLRQCHINADKALSGAQAIKMVANKKYDLIFMDHMMPEMDGIETTKALRDMGVLSPIVALTANAVSGARELLLSAGMDDFIAKPIDKSTLYRILDSWIPSAKIINKADMPQNNAVTNDNENNFWDKVSKINGLNMQSGLENAFGQRRTYKNTIEIFMRESLKSAELLKKYLADNDMHNFCVEVHGVKGSLSLVGATELAAKALELENASREKNSRFCSLNLEEFLIELTTISNDINDCFVGLRSNQSPMTIPHELPPILARITDAMDNADYAVLYHEIDQLDSLVFTGTVKDEIKSLKEAVMIMNYDYAASIIKRLTT